MSERRGCPHCGRSLPAPLRRCSSRRCPHYGPLWAGDTRRKLFENLIHYGGLGHGHRQVVLLTVTAPGADKLPWAEGHCAGLGRHRHDGRAGCRVQPPRARRWNREASANWSALHRSVMAWCRRRGHRPWVLGRVFELQWRGVLHVHPIVAYSTLAEKRAADAYRVRLVEVASSYGFGFVDRNLELRHPRAAAAYLSSYFVTGKRGKMTLQESASSGQMPRSIVYVHGRLTRETHCTMRTLRQTRHRWAIRRDLEGQEVPDEVIAEWIGHRVYGEVWQN